MKDKIAAGKMDLAKKIIIKIPVDQLWTSEKILNAKREAYLTKADIKNILNIQPLVFVVADVGKKLDWINLADCYTFWKSQAASHIADNLGDIILESFPDGYAFIASKWIVETQVIILLERLH